MIKSIKKSCLVLILILSIFIMGLTGCSNRNAGKDYEMPEGYSPTLYTDVGVKGLPDAGNQVAAEFFTKSQFSTMPFSKVIAQYNNHDVLAIVFEDNSALIYVYKDDTVHFGKYQSEKIELSAE